MKDPIREYPTYIQIICIPIIWTIMVFKLLIAIPAYVIYKCNTILDEM